MKKLIAVLFASLFSLLVLANHVFAQDTGWEINSFSSQIVVNQDSSLEVTELIKVDFANLNKHGIYRDIPVDYKDKFGNRLNIRLKLLSVTDQAGQSYKFQTSKKSGKFRIKIGDPNRTIRGEQTYQITYRVYRVITRFSDHDELYWNVTGAEWPVVIQNASAEVQLPDSAKDAVCFLGKYGTSVEDCDYNIENNSVFYNSRKSLPPGTDFTIVTAIPKGAVGEIPLSQKILWLVSDNWPYAIPLFSLLLLGWLYWRHGRDEQFKSLFDPSKGSQKLPIAAVELIPSTYAPLKDIRPAEAGTLIDEEIHIRDIASIIIDLAVRGYLTIEEIEKGKLIKNKDYIFKRTDKDESELRDYEKQLTKGLFRLGKTTTLSAQKYHFHPYLGRIRDRLYEQMTKEGYFPVRPDHVVNIYRAVGIFLVIMALAGGISLFEVLPSPLAWIIGLAVSGILFIIFAKAMPKRTAKGRREYLRVVGLRNFVSLGAYRQQIWEKANLFEEVMPYAIAFDLTHKWAEAFTDIKMENPAWFHSAQSFNANTFAYSLESLTRSTATILPSTKSQASSGGSGFSGGGFSGGGFGGGGGGSW